MFGLLASVAIRRIETMPALYLLLALMTLLATTAGAAASGCFPVATAPSRLELASLRLADVPAGATVQLTFLGHSSFLIETAGGVKAVTDYNGYIRASITPDIVTMNNAHSTHFTDYVEPGVQHVLRGWNPAGGEAQHDLTLRDLRVRNIPTSVHGRSGLQGNSNSIFIFEAQDLCIAHLGHLHHILDRERLADLGQIDVLLVPVDGAYSMSQPEMAEVIRQIGAALVVPMHYFGNSTLARFLDRMRTDHEVVISETPVVALSRSTLPGKRVLVLPGS
jgi:L-ascorbate metabolism protein UlaG (beta-lactamase superfamily)